MSINIKRFCYLLQPVSSGKGVLFYLIVIGTLFSSNVTAQRQGHDYSEPSIKTALIYNLLHFIEWSSTDLLICVYDPSEDYVSSFNSIPNSTKSGTSLEVKYLHLTESEPTPNNCHIIFISSEADNKNTNDILNVAKDNQSVTIGESKQFIKQGGMINFIRKDVNIKFEINAKAFEQANVKISSQVLRIADRVYR